MRKQLSVFIYPFLLTVLSCILVSCGGQQEESPKEAEQPVTIQPGSDVSVDTTGQAHSTVSQDSLAFFEDLSHEDKEKRDKTYKKVNELFLAHGKTLPNQASYSTLKYYEAFPSELIDRLRQENKEIYDLWAFYIGSELIFAAPEDEMLFATQKLQNIMESCYDCTAKDKTDREKFHKALMAVVIEKLK